MEEKKKKYESPYIELHFFGADVICDSLSGDPGKDDGYDDDLYDNELIL